MWGCPSRQLQLQVLLLLLLSEGGYSGDGSPAVADACVALLFYL